MPTQTLSTDGWTESCIKCVSFFLFFQSASIQSQSWLLLDVTRRKKQKTKFPIFTSNIRRQRWCYRLQQSSAVKWKLEIQFIFHFSLLVFEKSRFVFSDKHQHRMKSLNENFQKFPIELTAEHCCRAFMSSRASATRRVGFEIKFQLFFSCLKSFLINFFSDSLVSLSFLSTHTRKHRSSRHRCVLLWINHEKLQH